MAKKSMINKQKKGLSLLYQKLHPLPYMRKAACGFEEVRHLPHMLQGAGLQRADTRCQKGKLVNKRLSAYVF